MPTPIFLRQHPAVTAARIAAASSEDGLGTSSVTADSTNRGAMILRMSGTPNGSGDLNVHVQDGGHAVGYCTESDGIGGATVIYKTAAEASDEWHGYTSPLYLVDMRKAAVATGVLDYPQIGPPRVTATERLGHVAIAAGVSTSLVFRYKSGRRETWSSVTISTGMSSLHTPDMVVMQDGRLLAFGVLSGDDVATAWASDDDGATWTEWSDRTRITVDVDGGVLSCGRVRDGIVVAVGDSETVAMSPAGGIYWSGNGGATFAKTKTISLCSPRILVSARGQAFVVGTNTVSTAVYVWPVAFGGGTPTTPIGTTMTSPATAAILGAATLDDGSMWIVSGTPYPTDTVSAVVSIDHGKTWLPVAGSVSGLKNLATSQVSVGAYRQFALGTWHGSLVLLARVESATAAQDDSIDELWFGGWDDLTEEGRVAATAKRATCGLYGSGGVLYPQDTPQANGWTKTDTGGGATISVTSSGVSIVGGGATNSKFSAPAAFWDTGDIQAGDTFRFRWKTVVTSGGSTSADEAYLMVAVSDTVNRQWVKVRFTDTQARLLDNFGPLWTAGASAKFASETEWLMAFAHDYPSAGGGQVSLWYRFADETFWRSAVEGQAVAEEAGVATETLEFGGTVGSAVSWSITGPWYAPGSAKLDGGFSNPDDLAGRQLGAQPVYLSRGLSAAGCGEAGISGDDYTLTPAYAYRGANLASARPSSPWRTATTTGAESVVIGDGTMPIVSNMVALFGCNVRTATVEFNGTDSWGSPAASVALDATLYSTSVSASAAGSLTLTGARMRPGQYKSREGRRIYVQVKATNPVFYEVADNDETTLFVTGISSGYAGEMVWVYGDRMAATYPTSARMYARVVHGTATAPGDGKRQIGTLMLGVREDLVIPYDNGFVDSWITPDEQVTTRRGYAEAYTVGPEQHVLRFAWGLVDRMSWDELLRVVDLLRALAGRSEPLVLWRDTSDLTTLGLYRYVGPPELENAYGEGRDAFERLAQGRLEEIR